MEGYALLLIYICSSLNKVLKISNMNCILSIRERQIWLRDITVKRRGDHENDIHVEYSWHVPLSNWFMRAVKAIYRLISGQCWTVGNGTFELGCGSWREQKLASTRIRRDGDKESIEDDPMAWYWRSMCRGICLYECWSCVCLWKRLPFGLAWDYKYSRRLYLRESASGYTCINHRSGPCLQLMSTWRVLGGRPVMLWQQKIRANTRKRWTRITPQTRAKTYFRNLLGCQKLKVYAHAFFFFPGHKTNNQYIIQHVHVPHIISACASVRIGMLLFVG